MQLVFSLNLLEKLSKAKFDEKLSSGSRFFPCGRTDGQREGRTDGRTEGRDTFKVALHTFENTTKN